MTEESICSVKCDCEALSICAGTIIVLEPDLLRCKAQGNTTASEIFYNVLGKSVLLIRDQLRDLADRYRLPRLSQREPS